MAQAPQARIEPQSGHIVELQSLRGIAACAVMVGHVLLYYDTPQWFQSLAALANGRAGVVIFFVLSGYVLTRSLRRSSFDGDSVLRFYVQRLFRIYPAIWAASSLGLVYIVFLHWQIPVEHTGPATRSAFRVDRYDLLHIIASIAGMTTFILPQLWTIFVELVASLALPVIAFVAMRRSRWYPWVLIAALAISIAIPDTYYHTTMYFVDFVVGAGLAMPGIAERLFGKAPVHLTLAIAGVTLSCSLFIPLPFYSPYANIIETVFAASIIGVLVGGATRVKLLQSQFLLMIGNISYSIYLLHYTVMCILGKGFTVLQPYMGLVPLNLLLGSVTLLVTVTLAWLSYRFIEKPGIALGKACLQQMRRTNVGDAPSVANYEYPEQVKIDLTPIASSSSAPVVAPAMATAPANAAQQS